MRVPVASPLIASLCSCDGCAGRLGECDADEAHISAYTADYGDDGYLDRSVTYTWDDDGHMLTEESRGDGHMLYTYRYDDDGNLVEIEEDDEVDGTVDSRATNEWDGDGNLLTQTSDSDADGQWDTRWAYTYDDRGNRLSEEIWISSDDSFHYEATFSYDGHDNLIEACTQGSCETWSYTYDEDGNVATMCDDSGGCSTYEYRRGTLVSMVYEDDTTLSTTLYDDCERVVSTDTHNEQDWNTDGESDYILDETHATTYDEQGSVIVEEYTSHLTVDGDFDGVLEVDERDGNTNTYAYTYD